MKRAPAARGRSLRARLILWNALILAGLLAVLGAVVQYTVRAYLMTSLDRELADRAHRIVRPPRPMGPDGAGRPGGDGRRGGPPDGMPGPPPLEDAGPMLALRPRILDATGRVVSPGAEAGPWDRRAFETAGASGRPVYSTVSVSGEPVRVYTAPFTDRERRARVLQMPYPLTDVQRALGGLARVLLALLPVGILGAGWAAAFLTGRALDPVRRLTRTAARLSAEDLSVRLPVSGHDEFADLSGTFNGMLARLETAFGEQDRLVAELRRAVEQQRRFTADASHELRTPLTVIKANTSLSLKDASLPEEARQSMEDIDAAADAASRLVQDLLILARADAGQLARERTVLPIIEPLREAVERFNRQDGAPIRLDAPDAGLCVSGHGEDLVRLFSNLLENARRYTPADGAITVAARREGASAIVTVADTGEGIPPEHLPHLGERFYRVDPSRTRRGGGTGLGLAICRGIAEAHGGSLAFASTPGQGTTVTVTLPAA